MKSGDSHNSSNKIAHDFKLFIQAIGTIFFERTTTQDKQGLCEDILREVGEKGGSEFWMEIIE